MTVELLVKWVAKPGAADRLREIVDELGPANRAEPGCRRFEAFEDEADPGVLYLLEVFADEAALDAHVASDHVQRLAFGEAQPLLADHSLTRLRSLP